MVKQGHYAGTSTNKKRRQFKQRAQQQTDANMAMADVGDFLQGRFVLTQQSSSNLVNETMQRFLSEWCQQLGNATENNLDVTQLTTQTITKIATKVPWQFYALIVGQWPKFYHFLNKEVPAVPTKERLLLTHQVVDIAKLVAQQLAINWYLMRFDNAGQLATVTNENIQQLAKSFFTKNQINWQNVMTVYSTTPFKVHTTDTATGNWLRSLNELTPKQL